MAGSLRILLRWAFQLFFFIGTQPHSRADVQFRLLTTVFGLSYRCDLYLIPALWWVYGEFPRPWANGYQAPGSLGVEMLSAVRGSAHRATDCRRIDGWCRHGDHGARHDRIFREDLEEDQRLSSMIFGVGILGSARYSDIGNRIQSMDGVAAVTLIRYFTVDWKPPTGDTL
ncbi:MAG: hypothetical protein IPN96_18080 [Anaerolineales bacterium]|nr:hypothetical protein [Anaerolineales bacterium]